jgi:hypothetical protein
VTVARREPDTLRTMHSNPIEAFTELFPADSLGSGAAQDMRGGCRKWLEAFATLNPGTNNNVPDHLCITKRLGKTELQAYFILAPV